MLSDRRSLIQEKFMCKVKLTETLDNATVVSCEPIFSSFGGMWRSAGMLLNRKSNLKAPTEVTFALIRRHLVQFFSLIPVPQAVCAGCFAS